MHLVKDEANRKDKCSYDTSGVSPALALQNAYTPHMHTHTCTDIPNHSCLQVTSLWACLVNMPSLPSQVHRECEAFIHLIKG